MNQHVEHLRPSSSTDPLLSATAVVSPIGGGSTKWFIDVEQFSNRVRQNIHEGEAEASCPPITIGLGTARGSVVLRGFLTQGNPFGFAQIATGDEIELALTIGNRGAANATITAKYVVQYAAIDWRRASVNIPATLVLMTTGVPTGGSTTIVET